MQARDDAAAASNRHGALCAVPFVRMDADKGLRRAQCELAMKTAFLERLLELEGCAGAPADGLSEDA